MGKDSAKYWDVSWSPTVGCSHDSPGCASCWAEKLASSRLAHLPEYAGLTSNGRWTGEVRLLPERLSEPLHWKKPRVAFVDIMSDLFHPAVPRDFIVRVWAIILICCLREGLPHTFLVCSKRPERMRDVLASMTPEEIASAGAGSVEDGDAWWDILSRHMQKRGPVADTLWLGVTAENQAMANKRIPLLLQTPAARRWVSCEPLLGPVDLSRYMWPVHWSWDSRFEAPEEALASGAFAEQRRQGLVLQGSTFLDQTVVGGESGPGARSCDVDWIRSIVRQSAAASVPCFVKQWGSNPVHLTRDEHRQPYRDEPVKLKHRSGADPSEWPEELRVRELAWRKVMQP